ncbi:tetratricopeptide repeat-containing sulfotransferase family protein [Pontixanthobacter gangjinensis]|uniref:Tetratricopeptide repeat protein n=1 Tax=Pontixanthobacter gangjinensis TaxID=1028742 RepID=A0A6I4STI0_9SPHN|nr:tetratricopeptide repeat-containing sulfotransferase family protein [Pontixanthobacter gangjinensis]MXO57852.1 tetratricopeptide repeat protein [Pontixanthobacter gangjinensis]
MSAETELRAEHIKQAQKLLQAGNFAGGLAAAKAILSQTPDEAEALYLAAVSARYLKDYKQAEAYLARLHAATPEYGRAWQEAGHLERAKGDAAKALTAFQRATQFNPALEASWRIQAELLNTSGRVQEAAGPLAQADRLKAMPRELLAATNHLHEGRVLRAEEFCRHFLRQNPKNTEAMRLLAQIGIKLGVLDDAEFLLESARSFDPDNIQIRIDYIDALRRRQKFAQAKVEAEDLFALDPENPLFQSRLAIESMQTGEYERAFDLFELVLDKIPDDPSTLTSRGHALKTVGKHDEAVESYQAAFAAKPDQGDAYYALANLKTYRFSESEIAKMQAQIVRHDLAFMDRVHLSFALGKALEDRGEYQQSIGFYQDGNTLKRRQTRYDADKMQAELRKQTQSCTTELFAQHDGKGYQAADPIFIVGLPRAGSTLLEQILASHSQIDGTLELPNILALAHQLRGRKAGESQYPEVLHRLEADQLSTMGSDFIDSTRIHRQDAPYFIDKMPNNFRHIGLIKLILPNAKIIDARRDPMDCCFSGFKQLFAEGQEFTYGLEQIGRYYTDYVELMQHWDAVLPGAILRVQHEDVLDDLEGQVRRMLDYLGLTFEQACIDFHQSNRAVRTASSEQVRQPINRSGQGAWRPFEPWLDDLQSALGI